MSELYLHKYKNKTLKTSKSTIIANIDKINSIYKYEKGIIKKEPKYLVITGKNKLDFRYPTFIYGLPVKKVIIDCNIHSHYTSLKSFLKAEKLEITNNVKNIEIYNNYGLRNIENITIPFNINMFDNNNVLSNKIKTITIKYEDLEHIIELDDIFKNKTIDISISNKNNTLNIYIKGYFSNVTYQVYLENNELVSSKKYSRYEIMPNDNNTVLDLIELRKNIDTKFTSSKVLSYETIIISKQDYDFLLNMKIEKDKLKEIIIKDDNDMSLFPRSVSIKNDTYSGYFKYIENYDNNLIFMIEYPLYDCVKFIFVNEDLSVLTYENINAPLNINELILDFNVTKFSGTCNDENYIITIPITKDKSIIDYKILTLLLNIAKKVTIRNNNNEINIPEHVYTSDFIISNIKRYNDDDFGVLYDEIIDGAVRKHSECIIFRYDKYSKNYIPSKNLSIPYHNDENDFIKKLTKSV